MTCASRFLTGWVTGFATHDAIPAGGSVKTQGQTTMAKQAGPGGVMLKKAANGTSPRNRTGRGT